MTVSPILEYRGVCKAFRGGRRSVVALRSVSLSLAAGETLALVGESGGGKSTLGRLALGLLAADSGEVLYDGEDWAARRRSRRRFLRPQAIFQDPDTSLDPRWRAGAIVTEALRLAPRDGQETSPRAAAAWLAAVGLDPAMAQRYPHEFSGGQRQRLAIARALAPSPRLIVADEPLASLDVATAAQILELLRRVKTEYGMALLFISHHFGWVAEIADRIAVVHQGEIVECGPAMQVLTQPRHAFTEQLLSATPSLPTLTI